MMLVKTTTVFSHCIYMQQVVLKIPNTVIYS